MGQPLEAEASHTTHIREAEAYCATTITKTEACCATDIRKAESHCVDHACSIQQSHAANMQHLEMEDMEEEGRDHLSFLVACGVALHACPPRSPWGTNVSLQLLTGNMSLATLLAIPPQVSTAREESTPVISYSTTPTASTPSLGTK